MLIWTGRERPAVTPRFWRGMRYGLLLYAVVIFLTWMVMRLVDFAVSASFGWRP